MMKNIKEYKRLTVFLKDERFRYHLFEVVSIFFNGDIINFCEKSEDISGYVSENIQDNSENENLLFLHVEIFYAGDEYSFNLRLEDEEGVIAVNSFGSDDVKDYDSSDPLSKARKILKSKVYLMLSDFTGKKLPWGSLTGIRPAKIINKMLDDGMDKDEIIDKMKNIFFVSPKKANLAYEVALTQDKIRKSKDPRGISIYAGIPFCPTRCLYCSFTSNPIEKYKKLADTYIDTLIYEMQTVSERVRKAGLTIESIYVGGGTPTALHAMGLERLLNAIQDIWFNISDASIKEFCVEAGRPDSIDDEKLTVLKNSGVTRISINPQTMNDATLNVIGRCHNSNDFEHAFKLARDKGFDNINADIIAGLPGETPDMFKYTLDRMLDFKPENLTVHTMSIKRASDLKRRKNQYQLTEDIAIMIDMAYEYAGLMNLRPYYMYRQKNMLGNLENIGYSVPGRESYYNIHIMEEDQTILAFGSGGITKFVFPGNNDYIIQRVFNVKGVEEYIERIDEMIGRKLLHSYLN